jgi:hypothetical protein
VQGVFRKSVLRSQCLKGTLPFQLLGTRNSAGSLPGRIGAHAAQPLLPFGQDRVIELARGFQMGTETLRLAGRDLEREFQEKGWRPFARLRLLLYAGLPFPGHWLEASFSNLFEPLNLCSMILHVLAAVKHLTRTIRWPFPCPKKERRFIPRMNHGGFPARFL